VSLLKNDKCSEELFKDSDEPNSYTEREFFERIGKIAGIPVQNQQDWKLVRHSSPSRWHPARDQLRGTEVYGVPGDRAATHAWSVSWDFRNVTEFLFASVNLNIEHSKQYWLIMKKDDLMGEDGNRYYANHPIPIVASTLSSEPYSAKQYRRNGAREDPWISMCDHPEGIVHGEANYGGRVHRDLLRDGGGMNVYIR